MELIQRVINLAPLLATRSLFLFGPRQTGKSTYIRTQLPLKVVKTYNLLDRGLFLKLSSEPTFIRQEVEQNQWKHELIVIDEIQKCPELLDEIQLMIEEYNMRFLLTGSSARKLRRIGTNLLGGRARVRHMHPLTFHELGNAFDLQKAFSRGLIPSHYGSDLPDEDLQSYVGQYLTEEISAEGLSRNIPAFSRFLKVAASCNTEMINYTSIGSDCQVNRVTVQNYFQILIDTLLGYKLEAWTKSVKRKAIGTPKFYFFDMGFVRVLKGLQVIEPQSKDFGDFFEHFIFLELNAWRSYMKPSATLHYWRSTSDFEVDFILDGQIAIEVKSTNHVQDKHLRGLKALQEENLPFQYFLVCFEKQSRKKDNIQILPWKYFLDRLWSSTITF